MGPTQLEPARLSGMAGRGAGAERGTDFAALATGESEHTDQTYSGFGSISRWFDVDGDGQLDAIVSQRKEVRDLDTTDAYADGVVYVLFLDWRNRREGETLGEWRSSGPRLRQDVYGYGGGLGYAAYRVRRMAVAQLGLGQEGELVRDLDQIGTSAAVARGCSENSYGASALPVDSVWLTVGTLFQD